jgi:hypothetical protein
MLEARDTKNLLSLSLSLFSGWQVDVRWTLTDKSTVLRHKNAV